MSLEREREIGDRTRQFLEGPEWQEAFDLYKKKLHAQIEAADMRDLDSVMACKRLLHAAEHAKAHLELLVKHGKIAAQSIALQERETLLQRGKKLVGLR